MSAHLPAVVADSEDAGVPIFPRNEDETSAGDALMRSPDLATLESLTSAGVRATMRVPFKVDDLHGEFRCDSRTAREPSFELHAAAELFAQLFAMRLEIDHLKNA
jgi:light-regulated signal transduction histidine kinase (bacteriophytochrome)